MPETVNKLQKEGGGRIADSISSYPSEHEDESFGADDKVQVGANRESNSKFIAGILPNGLQAEQK